MNELLDKSLKLLVIVVVACVAIRVAYDAVRPALPVVGLVIVAAIVVRIIVWHRARW